MEIPIKDASPHPSAKFEDDKKQISKENNLKMDEAEFGPNVAEEIKKIAHLISKRRMAGKDEGAREWQTKLAKEYGLDENAFSKETVENIKLPSGKRLRRYRVDASLRYSAKLGLQNAQRLFENEKIARTGLCRFKAKDNKRKPPQGPPRCCFSGSEQESSVVKAGSPDEVYVARPVASPEDVQQAELNKAITDFEAKQTQISEMRAKKTGRFASLAKSLGIKTKNLSEDPEVMILEKESHDLYRNLLSKGIHLYKSDKPQLENFLKQFDEFEVFRSVQNQEMEKRAEVAGFPENILAGFHKIGKRWSELKPWQKIAVGAAGGLAIAGGALALGAGTFGAVALGAGWRWGFRGFGAISAGIGRKVLLDKKMMVDIDQTSEARLAEKMKLLQDYENNLDAGIAAVVNGGKIIDVRKNYEERSLENTKKAVNLAAWSFTISSVVGESLRASGISFGSVARKFGEYTGISLGGVKDSMGHFLSGSQPSAENTLGVYPGHIGAAGGATGAVEHLQPTGGGSKLSHEDFGNIKKTFENMQPGKNSENLANELNRIHESNAFYTHDAQGHITGLTSEGDAHFKAMNIEPFDSHPKASISDLRAPDAPPKMASSHLEKIASDKFGSGGSIERAGNNVLRAIKVDPAHYGLDPSDPHFSANANAMREKMIEEFYKSKGFKSYADFDAYARSHVQPKDLFKIDYDSTAGKFKMDYEGKAFSADVSHAAPTEEFASSKPQMAHEPVVKHGTAAMDHQPARGGKTMQYEADTPDQISAKKDFAMADQYQKDLRAFNAQEASRLEAVNEGANHQLFSSAKEGIEKIFHESGSSIRANILDKPMNEWEKLIATENYIAQDVQDASPVGKMNINLNKLKNLRLILGRYNASGSKTIGDCLKEAVKNPTVLRLINKVVL